MIGFRVVRCEGGHGQGDLRLWEWKRCWQLGCARDPFVHALLATSKFDGLRV